MASTGKYHSEQTLLVKTFQIPTRAVGLWESCSAPSGWASPCSPSWRWGWVGGFCSVWIPTQSIPPSLLCSWWLLDLLCCIRLASSPASHGLSPLGAGAARVQRAPAVRAACCFGSSPWPQPLLQQESSSSFLTYCISAPVMVFDRARVLSRRKL